MDRKKFTLIELMAVVAIVGILISILLPSLSKIREETKSAVCTNNLRQNMIAVFMSLNDQNGYYHAPGSTQTGTYYNPLWSTWLVNQKYIPGYETFVCPSRNITSTSGWDSYGSRYSFDGTAQFKDSRGGDLRTIDFTSNTWMIGDSYTSNYAYHRMLQSHNGIYAQPWLLHQTKGNIVFFDGHSESMSTEKYFKLGFKGGWSASKSVINF